MNAFVKDFGLTRIAVCGYKPFGDPEEIPDISTNSCIYGSFQLPVEYNAVISTESDLSNTVFPLARTVAEDLEFIVPDSSQESMYVHILRPKNAFARLTIPEWNKSYSTDIEFLKDTQQILAQTELFRANIGPTILNDDCDEMFDSAMAAWKEVKENPDFLDKYYYMDWEMLKELNSSDNFLQIMSVINLVSPLTFFLMPLIVLLVPLIILKIRGVPITCDAYMYNLQTIAKNHFIGKAISNMKNISIETMMYMIALIGIYIIQIYQNICVCRKYYSNIKMVNTHLINIRDYLKHVSARMYAFADTHLDKSTYYRFCVDIRNHADTISEYATSLQDITPFCIGVSKLGSMGFMLKKYHELHIDKTLEESIRFSFGFMGYSENMFGVYESLTARTINMANFDISGEVVFTGQYYPPHKDCVFVVNDVNFEKNIVLSGPNASGKTTILKSTCINIILTQQFGCGFYKTCSINPYTHIHSYLNIPDSSGRDSLFQAESRRCKDILDIIQINPNHRHFCIFDELYSGTNPKEATKAGYSFLLYLSSFQNVDFILTTHYIEICKRLRKSKRVAAYKMVAKKDSITGKITYTYKIRRGISKVQGAINILEDMHYPREIINSLKQFKRMPGTNRVQ